MRISDLWRVEAGFVNCQSCTVLAKINFSTFFKRVFITTNMLFLDTATPPPTPTVITVTTARDLPMLSLDMDTTDTDTGTDTDTEAMDMVVIEAITTARDLPMPSLDMDTMDTDTDMVTDTGIMVTGTVMVSFYLHLKDTFPSPKAPLMIEKKLLVSDTQHDFSFSFQVMDTTVEKFQKFMLIQSD